MSAQRTIRFWLAVIASIASFALSWPYWRDFGYWAESQAMWLAYFTVGLVLAIYVFYIFLNSLNTLFEHDALEQETRNKPSCDACDDTCANMRSAS